MAEIPDQHHQIHVHRRQRVIDGDAPTAGKRLTLAHGPWFPDIKKSKEREHIPVLKKRKSTQPAKQSGIAAISSMTTEPGSFSFRILSPAPHNQTERPSPMSVPPRKIQRFPKATSSANQPRPTTDPKVPGAKGIRPEPKPCAIHNKIVERRVRDPANTVADCSRDKASRI